MKRDTPRRIAELTRTGLEAGRRGGQARQQEVLFHASGEAQALAQHTLCSGSILLLTLDARRLQRDLRAQPAGASFPSKRKRLSVSDDGFRGLSSLFAIASLKHELRLIAERVGAGTLSQRARRLESTKPALVAGNVC